MASTLTNLIYHVVFSTKGREPMIVHPLRVELYRYMGGIVKNEGGILLQIGGMPDHLHLVLKLKPTHELSKIMQKIKGNSSKWINTQGILKDRFSWQDGYGAFSVSESQVPVVVRYVKEQEAHHRKLSFKDEFTQILERHQVEYEERYLWT
jgi:putative transposase